MASTQALQGPALDLGVRTCGIRRLVFSRSLNLLLHLSLVLIPTNKQDLQIPQKSQNPNSTCLRLHFHTDRGAGSPPPFQGTGGSARLREASSTGLHPSPVSPIRIKASGWWQGLLGFAMASRCYQRASQVGDLWLLVLGGFHTVASANRAGKRRLRSGNIPPPPSWEILSSLL